MVRILEAVGGEGLDEHALRIVHARIDRHMGEADMDAHAPHVVQATCEKRMGEADLVRHVVGHTHHGPWEARAVVQRLVDAGKLRVVAP